MAKGAFDQFIIKNSIVEQFTPIYERALWDFGFAVRSRTWDGRVARHQAIMGDKAQAFVVSHFVPFGSWLEEGNRYGAEAELYQYGSDIIFRLLVVPYMSIFDSHDYLFISQGLVEKILDDDRCREKLMWIINRLMQYRVPIYKY